MSLLNYKEMHRFIVSVFKKHFLLVQVPILLLCSADALSPYVQKLSAPPTTQAIFEQYKAIRGENKTYSYQRQTNYPALAILFIKLLAGFGALILALQIGLLSLTSRPLTFLGYRTYLSCILILFINLMLTNTTLISYFLCVRLWPLVGLLLLWPFIIACRFILSRFFVACPALLDQQLTAFESLSCSAKLVGKNAFSLFGIFSLYNAGIGILIMGVIPTFLNALIGIPLITPLIISYFANFFIVELMVASVAAYKQLKEQATYNRV